MGHKKYAQTQGNVMLKFFNANQKNFSRKLETILDIRKQKQKNNSFIVKKILFDVKNQGDKAVIKYVLVRISTDEQTTAVVVALPTPSAPLEA